MFDIHESQMEMEVYGVLYVMIEMVLTKIIWNKKLDFWFLNTNFGILATLIDPKESALCVKL